MKSELSALIMASLDLPNVVGLNAIDMMFFIPAYPFWALVIIAVDAGRALRPVRLRQPRNPFCAREQASCS